MASGFPLDQPYAERVYAGVLGKMIGVYLGRPIEGWPHRAILDRFGEVNDYLHKALGVPLVVPDDDLTGTFTFLRALTDYGHSLDLSPEQIGETWLNYLVEGKTILWWGGCGLSTEHTAYLRLKDGLRPPETGSIARNGKLVAEQIGAQIFIDGWGLVCPGDPKMAAEFARRAASVSHDGVAIECAQVVAAMVAAAFTAPTVSDLFEAARSVISPDGLARRLMDDVCEWYAKGLDWQAGFAEIERLYGYDRYGGNCHVVPNHAIILHALLHGAGDFDRSLMVANTCGWDTDCNSGNVGSIVGVLAGLDGIDMRWRTPVEDRLILPTADGGRTVSDAARETLEVVNTARGLRNESMWRPAGGARYHFALPGAVQGFGGDVRWSPEGLIVRGTTTTATLPPKSMWDMAGYQVVASPTLYAGQTVRAQVCATEPSRVQLILLRYGLGDALIEVVGPEVQVSHGEAVELAWKVPDCGGYPIAEVGLAVLSGEVALKWLTWDGEPDLRLVSRAPDGAWRASWVNAVDDWMTWGSPFRLVQNRGTGLLMHGTQEWRDVEVASTVIPNLVEEIGLAVRVQGMRRYYALLVGRDGVLRLVREREGRTVLAMCAFAFGFGDPIQLRLSVQGNQLVGEANGTRLGATDSDLSRGAVAFVLKEGRIDADDLVVRPSIQCEEVMSC